MKRVPTDPLREMMAAELHALLGAQSSVKVGDESDDWLFTVQRSPQEVEHVLDAAGVMKVICGRDLDTVLGEEFQEDD